MSSADRTALSRIRARRYSDFWYRAHDPRSARCCFFSLGHAVLALLLLLRPNSVLLLTQNIDRLHHVAAIFLAPHLASATYKTVFARMNAVAKLLHSKPQSDIDNRGNLLHVVAQQKAPKSAVVPSDVKGLPAVRVKKEQQQQQAAAEANEKTKKKATIGSYITTSSSANTPLSFGLYANLDSSPSGARRSALRSSFASASPAFEVAVNTVSSAAAVESSLGCSMSCNAVRDSTLIESAAARLAGSTGDSSAESAVAEAAAVRPATCSPNSLGARSSVPTASPFVRTGCAAVPAPASCGVLHEEKRKSHDTPPDAANSITVSLECTSVHPAPHLDNATEMSGANTGDAFTEESADAEQAIVVFGPRTTATTSVACGDASATCTLTKDVVSSQTAGKGAAEPAAAATADVGKILEQRGNGTVASSCVPEGRVSSEAAAVNTSASQRTADTSRASGFKAAAEVRVWLAPCGGWWGLGKPLQQQKSEAEWERHFVRSINDHAQNSQEPSSQQRCCREAPILQNGLRKTLLQRESESWCCAQQPSGQLLQDVIATRQELLWQPASYTYSTEGATTPRRCPLQRSTRGIVRIRTKNNSFEHPQADDQDCARCEATAMAAAAPFQTSLMLPPMGRMFELHGCMYRYRCSGVLCAAAATAVETPVQPAAHSSCVPCNTATGSSASTSSTSKRTVNTSRSVGAQSTSGAERGEVSTSSASTYSPSRGGIRGNSDGSTRTTCPSKCTHEEREDQQKAWLAPYRIACPYRYDLALDESDVLWCQYHPSQTTEERSNTVGAVGQENERFDGAVGTPVGSLALRATNVGGAELAAHVDASARPFNSSPVAATAVSAVTSSKPLSPAVAFQGPNATSAICAAASVKLSAADAEGRAGDAAVVSLTLSAASTVHSGGTSGVRAPVATPGSESAADGFTASPRMNVSRSPSSDTCSGAGAQAPYLFAGTDRCQPTTGAGCDSAKDAAASARNEFVDRAAGIAAGADRTISIGDLENAGVQIVHTAPDALKKQLMCSNTVFLPVCPYCYSLCLPLCLWFDEFLFFSHRAFESSEAFRTAFLFAGLFPITSIATAVPHSAGITTATAGGRAGPDSTLLTACRGTSRHCSDADSPANTLPARRTTTEGDDLTTPAPGECAATTASPSTDARMSRDCLPEGDGAVEAVLPAGRTPAAADGRAAGGIAATIEGRAHVECASFDAVSMEDFLVTLQDNRLLRSDTRCSGSSPETYPHHTRRHARCSWVFIGTSFSTASTDWLLLLHREASHWRTRAATGGSSSHKEHRVYNVNCSTCVDACFEATEEQQLLLRARFREGALFYSRLTHVESFPQEGDTNSLKQKVSQRRYTVGRSSRSAGVVTCRTARSPSIDETLRARGCASLKSDSGKATTTQEVPKRRPEICPQWLQELPAQFSAAGGVSNKRVLDAYKQNSMRRVVGDAQETLLLVCPPEVREWLTEVYDKCFRLFKSSIAGALEKLDNS